MNIIGISTRLTISLSDVVKFIQSFSMKNAPQMTAISKSILVILASKYVLISLMGKS